jgi:hypothetical protein
VAAVSVAISAAVPTVRGGVIEDFATGLRFTGFDIQANRNFLSGGLDLSVSNTFLGNELDFGPGDLTLQGPISLTVSTGGRRLSELEFAFRTAVDATSPTSPIRYAFNLDTGVQSVELDGTVLVDAALTLNRLGFYDLQLALSSRQTATQEGLLGDTTTNRDFDIGPINVSGNIFTDALALLTDPLFQAAGRSNPFAALSGREQLKAIVEGDFSGQAPGAVLAFRTVPEPAVLILILLGVPFLFRSTRKLGRFSTLSRA